MRKKVIAGNWKMNMIPSDAIGFIEELTPLVKDTEHEVILCAPYIDLFYTLLHVQGTNIKVGAQNIHWEEKGAYTGEVSAPMIKSIGVEYVIIGHSERRQYFAETDEIVNKKIKMALKYGLKPIVCVGESLEQRESGITEQVISNQIKKAFDEIPVEELDKIIIAYEPIWAIGTGKTATKEQANETIKQIRSELAKIYGENEANNTIIQYGGSVKAGNAKELFEMSDIDGGLIGGASLKAEEFSKIVNYDNN